MRLVIALGGNAILKRGQCADIETQRANIREACSAIAPLAQHHRLIITHGNGPQIGLLAQQSLTTDGPAVPLDVLGAESEGMIGYLLEQELRNQLPDTEVANILTQCVVDPADPAFSRPTKFIGPGYEDQEARQLTKITHWTMKLDDGRLRRVVPSPVPLGILELNAISTLSDTGAIVICAGGGGVPVVRDQIGKLRGIEAVIDKDLSSALLARQIGASAPLMLTDVAGVYRNWGSENPQLLHQIGLHELSEDDFEPGSMQPKVRAARQFVRETGCKAAIGATKDALAVYEGHAGTTINPLL